MTRHYDYGERKPVYLIGDGFAAHVGYVARNGHAKEYVATDLAGATVGRAATARQAEELTRWRFTGSAQAPRIG